MSIKVMIFNLERWLASSPTTPSERWSRLATLGLIALAVLLVVVWSVLTPSEIAERGDAQARVQLREAVLTETGPLEAAHSAPASFADGVSVRLPHRLDQGELRYANYRFTLQRPLGADANAPLALCVPRWSSGATVWLDGQLLRQPAPATAGLLDMLRPEFIMLPPGLGDGPHLLDIRLRAVPGAISGLSPIWFGDSTQLREGCWALLAGQRDFTVGNVYLMSFMGLVALAVAIVKRDIMALYFALMAAAWCSHHLFALGLWTSLKESTWLAVFYATRPLAALPLVFFAFSNIGVTRPVLRRSVLLLFGLAYAIFAVMPAVYRPLWATIFGLILLLVLLVLLFWLVRYCLQHTSVSIAIFCAALVLAITFNLLDVARALEWLPRVDRTHSFLAAPMLALGMGALMLERLVRYMGAEERSAIALRDEVARQRTKMARDYQEIKAQSERIAVLEERKRIVRDMHDGLGTQLVSASALLRSSPVASASLVSVIDAALLELRSVLDVLSVVDDSNDPDADPVSLLLGKLRHRLAPIFRAQGIEFGWQTDPLPRGFLKNDRMRLQLLRVLQEAFANVLKHSQARHVELSTQVRSDGIVLEVRDDGTGFEEGRAAGHGLDNMRQRTRAMGADLQITNLQPGTSVKLTFPWPSR